MPTSAPGNSSLAARPARSARRGALHGRLYGISRGISRGFTLIELMIVVALVALASGLVALSIRDPAATQLELEAARLASLLESARAESRASGVAVHWVPARDRANLADSGDFRFVGLPRSLKMPTHWIDPSTSGEVAGAASLQLGPEPIIGAQRIVLRLGERRLDLVTDGLGPFAVPGADSTAETRP